MNTRKTGAVALSAVAVIVAVSGCASLRAGSVGGVQSQAEFQDTARQESAQLRLESRGSVAERLAHHAETIQDVKQADAARTATVQGGVEGVRLAKQAESRSGITSVSVPTSTEAVQAVKQAESRQDSTDQQQHQLEHGASNDRLR